MKIVIDMQGAQTQSRRRGIGRHTRDLVRAFVQHAGDTHEIHLALSSPLIDGIDELLAELVELVPLDRIHCLRLPLETATFSPANGWRRAAAARLMRHQLDALEADWVWHTSVFEGFNEDAVVPDRPLARASTAAILYDVLPLQDPATSLPDPHMRRWYAERLEFLKRVDLLTSISDYSREDAIARAGLDPDRIATTGCIIDAKFAPMRAGTPALERTRERLGIPSRFALYAGGFDPRKNVPLLVSAYAALPLSVRSGCPLVLAGHIHPDHRRELEKHLIRMGLGNHEVSITGSIDDEELIALYSTCALFVFPSRAEGFGLTPAEAMACGAPTLASSATSLPEVLGLSAAMFDPNDPVELASKMQRVLTDAEHANQLRQYGVERVRRFTAEAVAARALQAFERHSASRIRAVRSADPAVAGTVPSPFVLPAWAERAGLSAIVSQGSDVNEGSLPVPEAAPRLIHVLDAQSSAEAMERATLEPGVILLDESVPSASLRDTRIGTYLGSGYHALRDADRNGNHDPLAALVPVLESSVGVLTRTRYLADRVQAVMAASGAPAVPVCDISEITGIEAWFERSHSSTEEVLARDIAALPGDSNADDLAQIAYGASAIRVSRTRRWFVDVTSIAGRDIGTGVHRVVRNILRNWLEAPPAGVRIEPVRYEDGDYRHARSYATSLLELEDLQLEEGIVLPRRGDRFVGLDWSPESLSAASCRVADWRRGGVSTSFLVHDLLPVRSPQWFHAYSRELLARWLNDISFLADSVVCVSRATAADYRNWLAENAPLFQFRKPPRIGSFFLGVDPLTLQSEVSALRASLHAAVQRRPSLLMVGTLEPRKGHRDALDTAERLWSSGFDFNLIIVGQRGWLIDDLIARIKRHPRNGDSLHWHDDVHDRELGALYAQATALLAASQGEGYGLPLIEAAQHGLPVLARDIPVFREVMGEHATYLPDDASQWDVMIRDRLLAGRGTPMARQWPTWSEAATALARSITMN
ncbi:glycosyltransferase family 1 protein [Lysobacter sp.]|uniref:glycosyltransferase family 4 protein n=1 Tax=Lysobacter sp. TaxID=72226 RepID=UPI002D272B21|nr:glycosyltransferase family 1 protein [Lysobacter sp.]HZX77175.1 glycosyltransferase family 1 protein [Lysobacter sp.]